MARRADRFLTAGRAVTRGLQLLPQKGFAALRLLEQRGRIGRLTVQRRDGQHGQDARDADNPAEAARLRTGRFGETRRRRGRG